MFEIYFTSKFKKDYKTVSRRKYNLRLLEKVITELNETGTVDAKFNPHKLSGKYSDCWECHIKGDWLLIWITDENRNEIWLTGTGTHSDLF